MLHVPQPGDRILTMRPPVAGGQRAAVQRVEFFLIDFNRWAVIKAPEANGRGEGIEVVATKEHHVWQEVERL